jgi:Winged helix-turn helix
VRGRRPNFVVDLADDVRGELELLQRRRTARAGEARRARVILLLAEGESLKATAAVCGLTVRNARKWVWRFLEEGIGGLKERPRPGRKPVFFP